MKLFKRSRNIFFTGIGGIGMSALAEILLENGYHVAGSDRELSAITKHLSDKGAKIYEGHAAANLEQADVLVYSSAIPVDNPERQEAIRREIPVIRRAEMLAEVMHTKYGIAIAGTHGKTTTTAMCSEIFIHSGLDPTVMIGGRLKSIHTNARLGKGDFFITEADEYDRSFLALSPAFAVITSIEADHLDCYSDFDDIKMSFIKFANKIPFYGSVVCCIDDTGVQDILPKISKRIITYGLGKESQFRAANIIYDAAYSRFDVLYGTEKIGTIQLPLLGEHNIKNALAALITAYEVNILFPVVKEALENFTGIERRFEIKADLSDILIVDDYAHHPTEVRSTLLSAKQLQKQRIIAIFQPHLYSRTRDFYQEFARALGIADIVVITDIYPARELPINGISSKLIIDELIKHEHQKVKYIPDKSQISDYILDIVKEHDLVIFMGAGDIWRIAENFVQKIKNEPVHN
jgi:UDP-N-acetylmuramate--alanine ligase